MAGFKARFGCSGGIGAHSFWIPSRLYAELLQVVDHPTGRISLFCPTSYPLVQFIIAAFKCFTGHPWGETVYLPSAITL